MRRSTALFSTLIIAALVAAPLSAAFAAGTTESKKEDLNVTVVSVNSEAKTLTVKTPTGEEKTAQVIAGGYMFGVVGDGNSGRINAQAAADTLHLVAGSGMSLTYDNATRKVVGSGAGPAGPAVREAVEATAVVLSLVAPYTAEDMWAQLGHEPTVARAGWPKVDEAIFCVICWPSRLS